MAKRIDRIVQVQIQDAVREDLRAVDNAGKVINLRQGSPNLSSEVHPPSEHPL